MKLGEQVGCVTRTNWLDFGEDPNPDTRIFFNSGSDSSTFWVWSVGRSPWEIYADDLKVKFPVVICPILTVYFSLTCYCVFLVRFCFKNRAILWDFVELVLLGAWGLSLRLEAYPLFPSVYDRVYLFFLPIIFNFYLSHFLNVPHPSHPTNHSISYLKK